MPPAKYQSETALLLQPTYSVTWDLTGLKYEGRNGFNWLVMGSCGAVLWTC